ncbi:hypothetical protein CDAR_121891 [Caerostris darwini]|uniref:Uncharacterized protein n=1 Tax=Caerostris darwini TaxID=1538125 RepID=A0AAV4R5N0_9ARAC|nr:hypothetical protein CDAR_121891 [Caerostris darwini]
MRRENSIVLTPQQNGVAKRRNHIVVEIARCWSMKRNRLPSRSLGESKTPYEIFFVMKSTVSYLKVFEQKAFVLNKRLKREFDSRLPEHIFFGY